MEHSQMFKQAVFILSFMALVAWGEEAEKEDIASFDISSPAIHCKPIQNESFPRVVCRQDKPPKRFVSMAPVESKATWDLCMSPYAGGEDLLFAIRILEKAETYMLGKSPIVYSKSTYARFWRLSELVGLWLPINYFAMLVQHEIFGHGYRIRDLNTRHIAKVDGYSFEMPPPYGPGGAATYFLSPPSSRHLKVPPPLAGGWKGLRSSLF